MSRRTAALLSICACLLSLRAFGRAPAWDQASFRADRATRGEIEGAGTGGELRRGFITPAATGLAVHAASITELSNGTLAASWYGGSREAAPDVRIYLATRAAHPGAAWSAPRAVLDRVAVSRELDRYVHHLGNPVVFAGGDGVLFLLFVSTPGGWSAGAINLVRSDDGGATWTRSRRLLTSPLLDFGALVRNRPAGLAGGGFAIPLHQEIGRFAEVLWLYPERGDSALHWRRRRIPGTRGLIQPALVPLGKRSAVVLFRSRRGRRAVGVARTSDSGRTWSLPERLDLPNPDAAVAALALGESRILLAFNDDDSKRDLLRLALSRDAGASWTRIHTVERRPHGEASYPDLLRGGDGSIHLVYTWDRQRIAHVVFDDAWVETRFAETRR